MSERREQYHNFLKSDWWKQIRERTLKKHKWCFICGSSNFLQIHHTSYVNAYKGRISKASKNTLALCGTCHQLLHKIQKEQRKSFEETNGILYYLKEENKKARQINREMNENFSSLVRNF